MSHGLTSWLFGVACAVFLSACVPQPVYRSRDDRPPVRETKSVSPAKSRPQSGKQATKKPPRIQPPPSTAHPIDLVGLDTSKAYQIGVASYYGKKFHGRKTANGEVFNMYKLTAAHRVLPLGTRVKVTNMANGRWVEVKVNDRGPFIEGRVLDLSFAAALELEMVKAGTARVMIEIVQAVD
jgi:rare lipoprotein A